MLVQPVLDEASITGAHDRGRAVATLLPADSPPAAFGRHEPGDGSPPIPPIVIAADGSMAGSLGNAADDDALRTAAADALLRGTSRTVTIGERQVFVEAFPVRPRLVIVGAVEVARSLAVFAKELGYTVVVVDGRASFATPERFPVTASTGWSSAGRTRSRTRSGSGATTPSRC